ncbi:MAG: hypothetical protein HY074_07165 [Deltaproteobacteria bacterium]|nr:hypothetical protein [Deltaproteobacteria bacterium]
MTKKITYLLGFVSGAFVATVATQLIGDKRAKRAGRPAPQQQTKPSALQVVLDPLTAARMDDHNVHVHVTKD